MANWPLRIMCISSMLASGCNKLMSTDGIEQLLCWAHVRRRFVEAVKAQPKGKRGLADEAVA
jgi:transposase